MRHMVDAKTLHVTSIFSRTGEQAVLDHVADQDEEVLVALGYKQEFKRYLAPFSIHSDSLCPSTPPPALTSSRSHSPSAIRSIPPPLTLSAPTPFQPSPQTSH